MTSRRLFFTVLALVLVLAACGDDAGGSSSLTTEGTAPQQTTSTTVATTSTEETTPPPQQATLTPEEIARAWMSAYADGDIEGYEDLMSPDAIFLTSMAISEGSTGTPEPYFGSGSQGTERLHSLKLFAGSGSIEADCDTADNVVTCRTVMDTLLGFPDAPYRPVLEFTVESGLIVHLSHSSDTTNRNSPARNADYARWLQETHPEDHDELFFSNTMLLNEADQAERHRTRIAEWAASQ